MTASELHGIFQFIDFGLESESATEEEEGEGKVTETTTSVASKTTKKDIKLDLEFVPKLYEKLNQEMVVEKEDWQEEEQERSGNMECAVDQKSRREEAKEAKDEQKDAFGKIEFLYYKKNWSACLALCWREIELAKQAALLPKRSGRNRVSADMASSSSPTLVHVHGNELVDTAIRCLLRLGDYSRALDLTCMLSKTFTRDGPMLLFLAHIYLHCSCLQERHQESVEYNHAEKAKQKEGNRIKGLEKLDAFFMNCPDIGSSSSAGGHYKAWLVLSDYLLQTCSCSLTLANATTASEQNLLLEYAFVCRILALVMHPFKQSHSYMQIQQTLQNQATKATCNSSKVENQNLEAKVSAWLLELSTDPSHLQLLLSVLNPYPQLSRVITSQVSRLERLLTLELGESLLDKEPKNKPHEIAKKANLATAQSFMNQFYLHHYYQ